MKITETGFEGLLIIEPTVIGDHRGFFMESYNKQRLKDHGIDYDFIQDNQSVSKYGTVRGLHFQNPPHAQTKLVRALKGDMLDVVVDMRKESKTFGKSYSIVLSENNKKQLIVPRGFAHGFSALSETVEILYKCDNYYNKEHEGGLLYSDPALKIDWQLDEKDMILSDKDKVYPTLAEIESQF